MKKTYINPEMAIVKIASHTQMLTSSPGLGGDYSGGEILSRGSNDSWDED